MVHTLSLKIRPRLRSIHRFQFVFERRFFDLRASKNERLARQLVVLTIDNPDWSVLTEIRKRCAFFERPVWRLCSVRSYVRCLSKTHSTCSERKVFGSASSPSGKTTRTPWISMSMRGFVANLVLNRPTECFGSRHGNQEAFSMRYCLASSRKSSFLQSWGFSYSTATISKRSCWTSSRVAVLDCQSG